MPRFAPTLLLCSAILTTALWVAPRAEAQRVVDAQTIQAEVSRPAIRQAAARIDALAGRNAADELINELEQDSIGVATGTVASEYLLDRGLHALSKLQPTPAARAFVSRLTNVKPAVFVRDSDHGGQAVPLYDPAATARYVQREWLRAEARERAQRAMASNDPWPLERVASGKQVGPPDPETSGISDAFRTAPLELLRAQRDAVVQSLERGENTDAVAAIVAHRLQDAELYEILVEKGRPAVVVQALGEVTRTLDSSRAFEVLSKATARDELASAAVLQMGRVASNNLQAQSFLLDQLADPGIGASAATALSSARDLTITSAVARQLHSSPSKVARSHAALALKLDGSDAARAELDRFVKSGTGSSELRREVRKWLEK